jgi:ubiquinone/menaquinone biosynthesis C-methylase UbiE
MAKTTEDTNDSKMFYIQLISALGILAYTYIYMKFVRLHLYAFFWSRICTTIHDKIHRIKKNLFDERFLELKRQIGKDQLKILELGVGSGSNFEYYPKNSLITCLDKNDAFYDSWKSKIRNESRPDLTINSFIINEAENMYSIESNSFDAVVHTFCLCSVNDINLVFKEICRVLKPGGICIFIETSRDTENMFFGIIQMLLQPLWSFLLDNWKFYEMDKVIETQSRCDIVEIKKFRIPDFKLFMLNPIVYGVARKS